MLLFVYGPYMNPKYLEDHGLRINHSQRAFLHGYEICFSTLTNDWRVAMVDIAEAPGEKLEGVLHDVANEAIEIFDDLERLAEGKHKRITAKVELQSGKVVEGCTFTSTIKSGAFKPSTKYIDVIIQGAAANALSPKHIDYLRSFAE